ncbi:MAG: pyridoxamine 5'-phosphate oxidase family protein, partial [Actinomycetota bacterium]|nr:pyridoxamine 5'-phosphate oxidase family protein [Actinomycetota bacterium]
MTTRSFDDPAIQAYLAAKDVVVLAMLTDSGAPLATPMWFVHDENQLAMVSVDGLAKIRWLERHDEAELAYFEAQQRYE